MRALIVYYSRTGNTGKIAGDIAKEVPCDMEEIIDTVNRSGPIGWVNSGKQASLGTLTKLQPIKNDPSQYDIVIIGTPVWAAHVSTPVRTYLTENKDRLKKVAFFITLGNIGGESTFKDMEALSGKAPVATLAVTVKELKKGNVGDAIKKFASDIQAKN